MTKLLLWALLFAVCWPLALLVLVVYPFLWLAGIPFRAVVSLLNAAVELVLAIVLTPFRALRRAV